MANEEHVKILKQGVEVWNRWRKNDLRKKDLNQVNLSNQDLSEMNLSGVNLVGSDLSNTILYEVNLSYATLTEVDFTNADLNRVDLSRAFLYGAIFTGASLSRVNFRGSFLDSANFERARMRSTIFVDVDLSSTKGLDSIVHRGPSSIGIDTIYRSEGKIPEEFLRGVGVPDTFISYAASLTGKAIHYYSCFISYSSQDEAFAQRLHADLQQKGVRCWFAPEDMKIGDKIRPAIDQSIRIHDKLLIILSEHSINSAWVEKEVETAFEEENERKQTVLFPVRLDEAVMETDQAWAADIRRTRHIGDFCRWKEHDAYQQAFERLLRDLKAEG
jgi:hypothetical protein